MTERIGAIVLAGGRSSRFGRDKLAEPIDGRPILDHAIEAVRAVATDIVVVIAPGASVAVPPGTRIVHDAQAFEGPLAGLGAGFTAIDPDVDRVVVVAGDMPSLQPAVLSRLIGALGPSADVVVLESGDRPVPLPMAVRPATAAPAVQRLLASGERRLRALPDALRTHIVPEATWRQHDLDGRTLRDIDTPADLLERSDILRKVALSVVATAPGRRALVAVDGVDGAGKTTFADELGALVSATRPVLRATVDAFHRPAGERYARGRNSPEGYYLDSYDYRTLRDVLLDPFATGGRVVPGVFDHRTDTPFPLPEVETPPDAVLIFDGIFLHRAELTDRWDLSIFLDVDFAVSIPRGAARGYGDPDPSAPSNRRYVEGQRLYLVDSDPRSRATYVIDNTDLDRPRLIQASERP